MLYVPSINCTRETKKRQSCTVIYEASLKVANSVFNRRTNKTLNLVQISKSAELCTYSIAV